jgi:hypothetical protein
VIARATLAGIVTALGLAPATVFAQQKEQPNPFIPQRSQVSFYGTGSAQFTPLIKQDTMATPAPTCQPKQTQVGFKVDCLSDSMVKSTARCRGSMSFYAFNVTRTVSGTISGSADSSFTMTLASADGAINGCTLGNQSAVTAGTANTVTMQGCGLSAEGCSGQVVGAGANHALTSSAVVTVTPAE